MAKSISITCKTKDFLPLDKIESLQGELKKISPASMDKLKNSIKTYGFSFPVFVWESGKRYYSIDGVHRCKALKEIAEVDGYGIPEQVPVVFINAKNRKQAKELLLAASSNYAALNKDYLINEYLNDLDLDSIRSNIELPDINIESLIANSIKTENDDEVPEDVKPITKPGDIWELGRHRVVCGDSTEIDNYKRLFGSSMADMVFTDPPYGVAIGDKNKFLNSFQKAGGNLRDIENDTQTPSELQTVLIKCFKNLLEYAHDHCSFYVTAPQGGELGMMMMMMMMSGIPARHVLMWHKNSPTFSMGRLDYDYQHEPILYAWKKKHVFYGNGSQKRSVWSYDKPRKCDLHPTMKPVELIENAILNSSKSGDVVADIFLGSGSTLIASEKTQRICRGMELESHYCDVIARRYFEWCKANNMETKIKLNGKDYKFT